MRWDRWPIVVVWLCAGCAPVSRLPAISSDAVKAEERTEQVAQIRDYYAKLARVDTVAFRIRTANAEFCKTTTPQIGMHAATVQSLPSRYRSFSREALGVSWTRPTAISVVAGAPADLAGIKTGDQLVALDGVSVPARRTAGWIAGYLAEHGAEPVQVLMRRDGVERTVTVQPAMACSIPIDYVTADEANASASDDRIVITSAIVTLARTDPQLALVIGHELAHANLGHLDKRRVNTALGLVGGAAVDAGFLLGGIYTGGAFSKQFGKTGARAFSVAFEREADYVGAYYAARAGYDITGAERLWRAFGVSHPGSIQFATTHPTSPLRFVQMKEVAAEIADKKRRHLPLVPELKVSRTAPDPGVAGTNSF